MLGVHADIDVGFLIEEYCETGEEIKEPEVDLSNFLARQRLDDAPSPIIPKPTTDPDEEEVDHSLAHLKSAGSHSVQKPMKGRVQTKEWDEELENMSREMAAADASRGKWMGYTGSWVLTSLDLKSRFRTSAAKQPMNRPATRPSRTQNKGGQSP